MRNRKWSRGESNPRPLECDVSVDVRRPAEAAEKSRNIGPPGPPCRRLSVVCRQVFTDRTPALFLKVDGLDTARPNGDRAPWAARCLLALSPRRLGGFNLEGVGYG